MSNLETLLTAWLNGGEIPADFKPTSRVEEYLLAILNGVDDDVDPKSRADVLLDAIATKYAGYADGITDLRDTLGFTGHPVYDDATTPELIAAAQKVVNVVALVDLQTKGVTGVDNNTIALFDAYENLPSGGAELNIAYGDTAPEDTTKLWVKADNPPSVTVDYNPDNTVETVSALSTVLPNSIAETACGVVGTKCYIFGGYANNSWKNTINVFDATTNTVTTLSATLPRAAAAIGVGVVGTKCYLFGGSNSGGSRQNTINVFDATTNTISTLSTTLPIATSDIAVGVVGTKCYLFGGYSNNAWLNKIMVFDTETNALITLPETLPAVALTNCCAVGTKCYLFGGITSGWAGLNTINVFDTETNAISTLSTTLPAAAGYLQSACVGTKCYLLGGSGNLDTINVFDATTNTISTLSTTLPTAVRSGCCGAVGTNIYIFGGNTSGGATNAIEKFNITFPLADGAIFVHEDMLRNKFTLVNAPTKVTVGVSAVSKGNAGGYAENCEAYLHDGTAWQPIT